MANYTTLATRYTYGVTSRNDELHKIVRALAAAGFKNLQFEIVDRETFLVEVSEILGGKDPITVLEKNGLVPKRKR